MSKKQNRLNNGATLEADAAILTVPLPVLPEIALPQAVREKAAASTDIGFGNVVKILLRFTTKWWRLVPRLRQHLRHWPRPWVRGHPSAWLEFRWALPNWEAEASAL